jgi:hypothetical protein
VAGVASLAVAAGVAVGAAPPAAAFKPYTHVMTGKDARADVIDDGRVTINGHSYDVDDRVVAALTDYPSYYNAGVIGPDGFPDLVMGQSVIHPENTGLWLRHILGRAWAAQDDPGYSAAEKSQVLAFAFGYLTHASGDMWMHTMVNEFAEGTFPGVGDILTDVDDASIALRHLVVEGYVGDATEGFDGDATRTALADGDVSDDSTPGIHFDVPQQFVYDTLVARSTAEGGPVGPSQDRGKVLDFFYGLRQDLAARLPDDPDPLAAAVAHYNDLDEKFAALDDPATCRPEDAQVDDDADGAPDDGCGDSGDPDRVGRGEDESGPCSFGVGNTGVDVALDVASDVVSCPVALAKLGLDVVVDSLAAFKDLVTETLALALDAIADAYVAAWIDDIDAGLKAWPQLGLDMTRALFDPQTRRDLQNFDCRHDGADTTAEDTVRSQCEDGVGTVDVVLDETEDFQNEHLIPMLGLPDALGDLRASLSDLSVALDDVIGESLNPLRFGINAIKQQAKEYVKKEISERYGIDVDEVTEFLDSPSSKMDVGGFSVTLPVVGTVEARLFRTEADNPQPGEAYETDHEKLDRYLGLPADHHGGAGGGLDGDLAFDPEEYAAYYNTTVLNRMLLLDGSELDRLMSDLTGGDYHFYEGKPLANVMLTSLSEDRNGNGTLDDGEDTNGDGVLASAEDVNDNGVLDPGEDLPDGAIDAGPSAQQWLTLIDGDHAWRSNAKPVFDKASAGHGNFPLWESCALRPAFRQLFRDWEHDAGENFPDEGDAPSYDPNDPTAPESTVTVTGTQASGQGGQVTYVTQATRVEVSVRDDFWKPANIALTTRVLDEQGTVVATPSLGNGDRVSLQGLPDGTYRIETKASDACGVEAPHERVVVLDTTAPVITISSPTASTYDTDDAPVIAYSATDGPPNVGSGVDSDSVTFDGARAKQGDVIDAFFLAPGMHRVDVVATDRVGNTATLRRDFRIRATSESLLSNVDRARSLGLITNNGAHNGLRASVEAALRSHLATRHDTEANELGAFVGQLEAKRSKGVDTVTANRFIAYAKDLVAAGG